MVDCLRYEVKDDDMEHIEGDNEEELINLKLSNDSESDYIENLQQLNIQWLELIIHNQTALSQLLHAEASHIETFLSDEKIFLSQPTRLDMLVFQETIGKVFDAINENQRLQIKLLDTSLKLFQQGERFEN